MIKHHAMAVAIKVLKADLSHLPIDKAAAIRSQARQVSEAARSRGTPLIRAALEQLRGSLREARERHP